MRDNTSPSASPHTSQVDSSGIILYYTQQLRNNTAAVLRLGYSVAIPNSTQEGTQVRGERERSRQGWVGEADLYGVSPPFPRAGSQAR